MSKESTKALFQKAFSDHGLITLSEEDIRIMNTYYTIDIPEEEQVNDAN